MPPDFRRLLRGALFTSPSLLAAVGASVGCNKPPPAVAPAETAPVPTLPPAQQLTVASAEREPGTDREGPTIRSAQFINPQRIRLTFSEPIAPSDGVNPRQFRLSVSYVSVDLEGYGYANYADIKYQQGEDDKLLVVRRLERYADEHAIGLDLSEPVPVQICAEIKDVEMDALEAAAEAAENPDGGPIEELEMGLYLHYTSRGSAAIHDLAGNKMESFGASWALNYGARYIGQNGEMPVARLDLLVKVPCFDLPDEYGYMDELESAYESAAYGAAPAAPMRTKIPVSRASRAVGVEGGVEGGVPGGVPGGVSTRVTSKATPATKKPKP